MSIFTNSHPTSNIPKIAILALLHTNREFILKLEGLTRATIFKHQQCTAREAGYPLKGVRGSLVVFPPWAATGTSQQTMAKSELHSVYGCDKHVPFSNLGHWPEGVISHAYIVQIEMIDLPY
jgi:hypothetical protein